MQKNTTIIALTIAGLLVAVGSIYLISAYEEPIQAAQDNNSAAAAAGDGSGTSNTNTGMDMGTLVQTIFFAIAGLASLGIAAWIVVIVSRSRRSTKIMAKASYTLAAAGSAFLIVLYIASRTINLPIVGIQTDIGIVDIVTKIMQGIIVGLSVYAISIPRKMNEEINNRMRVSHRK